MLKSVPHFLRGRFRHSLSVALQERCRAKLVGDRIGEERAWKVFGLVPAMLLHKPKGVGSIELMERANKFARGSGLCYWKNVAIQYQAGLEARVLQAVPNPTTRKRQNKEDVARQRAIG